MKKYKMIFVLSLFSVLWGCSCYDGSPEKTNDFSQLSLSGVYTGGENPYELQISEDGKTALLTIVQGDSSVEIEYDIVTSGTYNVEEE